MMPFKFYPSILLSTLLSSLLMSCGGGNSSSNTNNSKDDLANTAPVAIDDVVEIFVNNEISISVLNNDSDANSNALSITAVTSPGSGTANISGTSISYVPNDGFIGSDTFSYTISDGNGGSGTATVSIEVANKPPTAVNDLITTAQSTSIDIDLLANDSSAGGLELTVVNTSSASHGQIALANNQISYVPQLGFVGNDSFGYVVRDSLGDESTATVSITIENILPESVNDNAVTEQNTAITLAVLDNDIDAIGDNLTISGTSLTTNGTVEIVDNEIVYTPDNGYVGIEEFTYTVSDKYGATDESIVAIEITNVAPTVVDDQKIALSFKEVSIDVLANDVDVEGDMLTISSVSEPANGIASIVDNQVIYRSNQGFEGEELIGYTVIDSAGDTSSGFIEVSVNSGIFLHGKVVNVNQANIDITFTAGSYTTVVQTDSSGEFSAQISIEDSNAIVIASLNHPDAPLVMKRYFSDVGSLLANADENLELDGQDISVFSTAEYELVGYVTDAPVSTLEELRGAQQIIDSIYLLDFAAATTLIVNNNGITLPDSYSSVNELMASPFELRKQLAIWRGQHAGLFNQVYNHYYTSDENSAIPLFTEQLNTQFNNYSSGASIFTSESLVMKNDNSGYLLEFGTSKKDFSWQISADDVLLTFNEEQRITGGADFYCGDGVNVLSTNDFYTESMGYRYLYRLGDSDIYLRQREGRLESSNCFDESEHNTFYDTLRVIESKTASISSGEYYLTSIKDFTVEEQADTSDSYHHISALFNLAEDGTFEETIDQFTAQRSGSWAMVDDNLTLSYDDGLTVAYQSIAHHGETPIWSFSATENNSTAVVASGVAFKVNKTLTTYDTSSGMFVFYETPLTDFILNAGFALEFNVDGTGVQASYSNGEWSNYATGKFSWSVNDNLYSAQYYRNPETYEYSHLCDVIEVDCEQWRYREFEIIGQEGELYLIKNYQEWELPGSIVKSGYIGLFELLPNR